MPSFTLGNAKRSNDAQPPPEMIAAMARCELEVPAGFHRPLTLAGMRRYSQVSTTGGPIHHSQRCPSGARAVSGTGKFFFTSFPLLYGAA